MRGRLTRGPQSPRGDRFSSPSAYRRGSLFRGSKLGIIAVAVLAILAVVLIGGCSVVKHAGEDHVTFTVQEKQVKRDGDSDKYLVFTKNVDGNVDKREVFENTDSFMYLKTDSSDLQGFLEVGKTYNCKVWGWRISLSSTYRNLINCDLVP